MGEKRNGWVKIALKELRRVPNLPDSNHPDYFPKYMKGMRIMDKVKQENPRRFLKILQEELEKHHLIFALMFAFLYIDYVWLIQIIL